MLRRCYSGRELRTYSRYGLRQWAAALPGTRIIIKDPFAMLSLAAIHHVTDARPVMIYRHPAAVLASYRRMGWTPDTAELTALGAPAPGNQGDVEAMTAMWTWCHQVALKDLQRVPGALVISHTNLTLGGAAALSHLRALLGLLPVPASSHSAGPNAGGDTERREGVLHDFNRSSAEVDASWRQHVPAEDIAAMEVLSGRVWQTLEQRQLRFPSLESGQEDVRE